MCALLEQGPTHLISGSEQGKIKERCPLHACMHDVQKEACDVTEVAFEKGGCPSSMLYGEESKARGRTREELTRSWPVRRGMAPEGMVMPVSEPSEAGTK